MITFDQLSSFLAVAKHLNFSKAAEAMFISHSSMSRNISNLERSLNVQLFIRDNRAVRLTHAGEVLKEKGEVIMNLLSEVENDTKTAGVGLQGKLIVNCSRIYNSDLFEVYKAFCDRYPEILFRLTEQLEEVICEKIMTGSVDLGITFSYVIPEHTAGLEQYNILEEEFCLVVRNDHPLASKGVLTKDDLRHIKMICYNREGTNFSQMKRIDAALGQNTFSWDNPRHPENLDDMMLMVRAGGGAALLPRPTALENSSGCRVLDIVDLNTTFFVTLIWKSDNTNPSLKLFLDIIKRTFPNPY